jgi:type VI secretion system protein
MALKLRVISEHYKKLGRRSSCLFGVTGGRIGRAHDNDWVLPDPDRYVSSHHAKVQFRAGQWVLEDTSTNGVFVNGSDTPLSIEGAYTLKDGDRLRFGEYEILVSIDDRNDFPPEASGQMPIPPAVTAKRGRSSSPRVVEPTIEDLGEDLDITDLLNESAIRKQPPISHGFELTDSVEVPQVVPALRSMRSGLASLLDAPDDGAQRTIARDSKSPPPKPDDWQMQTRPYDRRTMGVATSPAALAREAIAAPAPAEKPRRATDAVSEGLEAFCRGAGIDPAALPLDAQNAVLTLAGQMTREVVLGLMEALKHRADTKSRLRLSQTTIQPAENNPLKFSASVDEAVLKLLDPHSSRYLGPIEAIRSSFADLKSHQQALISAAQSAVDELMSRIEPGELQERFDRGLKRGPLLGATNRMKYWDLYIEFYQVLNQRNEHGLPPVFAEEFARAYAEKVGEAKKKK